MKLIIAAIKYPAVARENGIQGTVIATVYISEKGELEHVEIFESVHESVDTEVLRVINEHFYLWQPGSLSGQAIPSQTQDPMRFRLE